MAIISYEDALKKAGISSSEVKSVNPETGEKTQSSVLSNVVNKVYDIANKRVSEAKKEVTNVERNPIVSGFKATEAVAKVIPDVIGEVAKPVIETAKSNAEKVFGGNPIYETAKGAIEMGVNNIKKLTEGLSNTEAVAKIGQKLNEIATQNPELEKTVYNTLDILKSGGDIANSILAVEGGKDLLKKLGTEVAPAVKEVATDVVSGAKNIVTKNVDTAFESASNLKKDIQLTLSEANVNPQLKSSAQRLFVEGTKNLEDPVKTYDRYLEQSKKALTDVKQDPAISQVGEKIGNAFDSVVEQRKKIGSVVGEELKTNGKLKINVSEPKDSLINELKSSGLSYNPKTNSLTSFQGTKFAPDEINMLNSFVKDVNGIGSNPTVSAIDNLIAKTRSQLEFTKGQSGVIGTTNAERIINDTLAKLKDTLNPQTNGYTQLDKYWKANKAYSELSDFVDEGASYLGKITQSGDFAKDASIAKSSVQSVLNGGKKDWLARLEALTGYKALDEAVLALQAMKDAGDFRGTSLLQAISEGAIPTSKSGFTQQIIDYAIQKGSKIVAGTPEEQTRALLKSLKTKTAK